MSELLALVVVCVALAAGLLANRWVRPFADSDVKDVKFEALVGPIMSLTVLRVGFIRQRVRDLQPRGPALVRRGKHPNVPAGRDVVNEAAVSRRSSVRFRSETVRGDAVPGF